MSNENDKQSACYAIVTTARGECGLVWDEKSKLLLQIFIACPDAKILNRAIYKRYPGAQYVNVDTAAFPDWLQSMKQYFIAYYAGDMNSAIKTQPDWPWLKKYLNWFPLTGFSRRVLETAFRIKSGTTISYGELAQRIKRPGAARAVGGALARNPWPVIIPCHRVVGHDGSMTGFSAYGEVAAKQWMLEMEKNTPKRTFHSS